MKFQTKHFLSALRWQELETCGTVLPGIPLLDIESKLLFPIKALKPKT